MIAMSVLGGCAGSEGKDSQAAKTASEAVTATSEDAGMESEALSESESSQAQTEDTEDKTYRKAPDPVASEGSKFLFVGNSHTYVNDLPIVFYELAAAGGHKAEVKDVTAGSYTLEQFSDPQDEYGSVVASALSQNPWDFVILQENTNAALSARAESAMYPYARKLDELIKKSGGQTAFLMTWAPKDGAQMFSREMVQTMLSEGYTAIAEELDALLIPGGDIFTAALIQDPELELWGEDGQHPSAEGIYLAACGAYALFFQESPVGNSYLLGMDEKTARKLQEIAGNFMLGQE